MDLAIEPSGSRTAGRPAGLAHWVGRALSGLSLLFLAFDALGKLVAPAPVVRATAKQAV